MDLRNALILLAFGVVAVFVVISSDDFTGSTNRPDERVESAELGIWSFKMNTALAGLNDCNATAQVGSKEISIIAKQTEPLQVTFRGTDKRFQTTSGLTQLSFRIDDRPVLQDAAHSEIRSQGNLVGVRYTLERNSTPMDQFVSDFHGGTTLDVVGPGGLQIASFPLEGADRLFDHLSQC